MSIELDNLIRSVTETGEPAIYETMAEDFGPLLSQCLVKLLNEHPDIRVKLLGTSETLAKFGLYPSWRTVGVHRIEIAHGLPTRLGSLRVMFVKETVALDVGGNRRVITKVIMSLGVV